MTREHTVAVKLMTGTGAVTHCAGHRYDISIKPGETLSTWGDGSPITRQEFGTILEPTGLFEVTNDESQSAQPSGEKEE
jgi:hypothetical protein